MFAYIFMLKSSCLRANESQFIGPSSYFFPDTNKQTRKPTQYKVFSFAHILEQLLLWLSGSPKWRVVFDWLALDSSSDVSDQQSVGLSLGHDTWVLISKPLNLVLLPSDGMLSQSWHEPLLYAWTKYTYMGLCYPSVLAGLILNAPQHLVMLVNPGCYSWTANCFMAWLAPLSKDKTTNIGLDSSCKTWRLMFRSHSIVF